MEYLVRGEIEKGIAALRSSTPNMNEERLATIGSNLLDTYASPRAASAVFRLIVERYPTSPGAWDVLGGALKRSGDRAGSITAQQWATQLQEARSQQKPVGDGMSAP
jgi:hypothetical protein